MKEKRAGVWAAAMGLVAICLMLVGVTYAWFTFDPYTKVVPMEARISEGDANLLISEKREGPFGTECDLHPSSFPATLSPVSTVDLDTFHIAGRQDRSMVTSFKKVSPAELSEILIAGTVYLKCEGGKCSVYLQSPPLDLGSDPQWLAAGRLALRITGRNRQQKTYIFRLDDLGQTSLAQTRATVSMDSSVVNASGQLTADPSVPIGSYLYGTGTPAALFELGRDEIAQVDYWLYLEGCDTACYNPVQSRDLALKLGFAGQGIKEAAAES